MAARINNRHQDMVRDKIQASQLINRLADHALGEVEMSATQVKAAETLLKKVLPDLKAIEADVAHSGDLELKVVSFLDVSAEQLET